MTTASPLTYMSVAMRSRKRPIPDDGLCARIRAGDEQAFRDVVRKHHASMVRFAQTFVGSRASAEEVVQDTWLAVIAGIDQFEERSSLTTWIYSIVANKARTRGTRDARMVAFSDTRLADDETAVDPSRFDAAGMWRDPPRAWDELNPERIVAGRELWVHVTRILDRLPPMQRAVLILHDVEGQSAAATCELLQLTEANQRVLLHRARAKIRCELELLLSDAPGT